jgi:hypothetical protein
MPRCGCPWVISSASSRNSFFAIGRVCEALSLLAPCRALPAHVAPYPRQGKSIPEQGKWLRQVVTGFFNYHAVPTTGLRWEPFEPRSPSAGAGHSADAAKKGISPWFEWRSWQTTGSQSRESSIPGQTSVSPSSTRGKSRMHKRARTDPHGVIVEKLPDRRARQRQPITRNHDRLGPVSATHSNGQPRSARLALAKCWQRGEA